MSTTLPIYQVDAFADRPFTGNPAAVCPLPDGWLPVETMQAIAAENNLAETAFVATIDGVRHIRWFTPEVEVDLCGHATLAAAHVLRNHLGESADTITFETEQAGAIAVSAAGDRLVLDFPSRPPAPVAAPANLAASLGAEPVEVLAARDLFVVVADEPTVRRLQPDFRAIRENGFFAVIVTAPGDEVDFVSRFFAPAAGIDEDPVTGSAHCTLTPFWAERLQKNTLHARQLSRRGGEIFCELHGDRVGIGGHAVTYLVGEIVV